jgi:hypothetical protein
VARHAKGGAFGTTPRAAEAARPAFEGREGTAFTHKE